MRQAFVTALLALASSAHADTSECEIHKLATYPFPHRPTAEQAAALKDCDADKLYYGIGVHFDYVKARHCAFAADSQDVLMMLYANGLGVPRNYAVAKMAACRADATEIEARLAGDAQVAWHPPCTLQHGQQIRGKVEGLLRAIGVDVKMCRDAHLCCGSAGTYSILQPELSLQLRDRKLANLADTGAGRIVSANIGCIGHLQSGTQTPVEHWIELVDRALHG